MTETPPYSDDRLLAHADWVRGVVRAMVRDEGLADDLAQDALEAGLRSDFGGRGSPRAWLAGVVRNLGRQHFRSDSRRSAREERRAGANVAPPTSELVARVEIQERVARAVVELPQPYRRILLLRYYENLPVRRIAALMELPVTTVKSQVRKGHSLLRSRLRESIGPHWASAVLPLSVPAGGISTIAISASIIVMKKNFAIAGLAAIAVLGGTAFLLPENEPDTSEVRQQALISDAQPAASATGDEPPIALDASSPPVQRTEISDPTSDEVVPAYPGATMRVTVLRSGGQSPAPFADLFLLVNTPDKVAAFRSVLYGSATKQAEYAEHGIHFKTDAAGVASLPLPGADWSLLAVMGSSAVRYHQRERIGDPMLSLTLERRRQIDASVFDSNGQGVSGVQVSAFHVADGRARTSQHRKTDSDGRARFDCPERVDGASVDWTIAVSHLQLPPTSKIIPGDAPLDASVEFVLPEGAPLRFDFIDENGAPETRRVLATVELDGIDEIAEAMSVPTPLRRFARSVDSSWSGTVELPAIPTEPALRYRASIDGGGDTFHGRIPGNRSPGEVTVIEIQAAPLESAIAAQWAGKEVAEWRNMSAEAFCLFPDGHIYDRLWQAGSDGRVLIDVSRFGGPATSTCVLELTYPQSPAFGKIALYQYPEFQIPVDRIANLGVLQIDDAPIIISGRVIDAEGKPVSNAEITLSAKRPQQIPGLPEDKMVYQRVWSDREHPLLFAGDDGRFEVRGRVELDEWQVSASAPGQSGAQMDFSPGASDVLLQLDQANGLPFEILTGLPNNEDLEVRAVADQGPGTEPINRNQFGRAIWSSDVSGTLVGLESNRIYEIQVLSKTTREILASVGNVRLGSQSGDSEPGDSRLAPLDLRGSLNARELHLEVDGVAAPVFPSAWLIGEPMAGAFLGSAELCILTKHDSPQVIFSAPGLLDLDLTLAAKRTTATWQKAPVVEFVLKGLAEGQGEAYNVIVRAGKRAFSGMFDADGKARVPIPCDGPYRLEVWANGARAPLHASISEDGLTMSIPVGSWEPDEVVPLRLAE